MAYCRAKDGTAGPRVGRVETDLNDVVTDFKIIQSAKLLEDLSMSRVVSMVMLIPLRSAKREGKGDLRLIDRVRR